jgi:protein tyrosine phosphatase (PTP) superfamily phosphohydrolase (DUF442 family)
MRLVMIYRLLAIVCISLAVGCMDVGPVAQAKPSPEKPATPKNIDQTPPLVPIPNARVSEEGLLVGGQPTPDQLRAIQQAGYRMVVSLRTAGEKGDEGEQPAVERLGMKFVSIPVAGPDGLTKENARALSRALSERDVLPAVVHCSIGERAAALLGLEAFVVDRLSAAAAIDLAKRLGMRKLESALRERIREICKADVSRNCEEVQ